MDDEVNFELDRKLILIIIYTHLFHVQVFRTKQL